MFEDQLTGAPGGPQPPQPGSPEPSSPPGTPPAMPPMDLGQGAPAPDGQAAPVQVADAASSLQQSLPPQTDPNLDETIRRLQDSLKPRDSTGMPGVGNELPVPPGAPGVTVDPGDPAAAQEQFSGYPNAEKIGDPSMFGRAVMRLFGTDVDDPLPLTRMGTTLAGGLGGAAVGAGIPGPPIVKGLGAIGGGLAGTVMGAMAPENMIDTLEMTGFLEPGSRDRLGLNDEQLKTLLLGEAALDIWFMGGVGLARAAGRGLTNVMTGANATSRGLAEVATREGIALLPVQVGEGTFARGYVSVMGRLPLVANAVKSGSIKAMDNIGRMFDGIPERLGPVASMDEVSANILRDAHYTAEGIARHFDGESARLLAQADMMQVKVRPVTTRTVTDSLMKQLEAETPKGFGGQRMPLPDGSKDLRAFLSKTTRLLTDINPQTMQSGTAIVDLPLRQMDTIIKTIDQKMAKYAESGDVLTLQRFERLRNALQADSLTGMVPTGGGRLGSTPQSTALMAAFRNLDEDLTYTVNQLFQSTTAQRLGAKTSPTGRAAQMANLGTKGMDKMGEVILRGDNPQAIAELGRLTSHNTMRQLGNAVFNKALEESYTETSRAGVRMFDVEKFSKSIGLDAPTSSKYRQTEALLNATGGLTMAELHTFTEFTRRASAAEIPDVSTFLARKLTLGGIGGFLRTAMPVTGMAAAVGGAHIAGGFAGSLLAGATTLGGSRLVSSMISNPQSARALRAVFDLEASAVVKKAAYTRAVAYGVHNMVKDGHIDARQADNLIYNTSLWASAAEKEMKRNAP